MHNARRIVGWRVSRTAHAGFVLDALEQALHDRRPLHRGGLVHHSDSQWMKGQFPGGLTLTAIDRLVGWRRKASRCGLTPTPIDPPCLSPDLSAARERLAVRFCLADACDPRRA
jgi:hypothetical protein